MKFYATIFYVLMMVSCKETVYDLERSKTKRLVYSELPTQVSQFIDDNIDSITSTDKDIFYSTDLSIEFTYGRGGVADSWIKEVNSNYHHFFIEGVHYRLKGNKGHPFILHDGFLFYCDLNLYKDDFMQRPYFRIKIPPVR